MSGSRVRMLTAVVLIVVLALAVGGCQMIAQKAVEQATGVKVDKNGDSVTITGKDGASASTQKGTVPDGWPADVPVYQGTITTGNKYSNGTTSGFMVVLETPDDAKKVVDWYEEQLTGQGWTKVSRNDVTSDGKTLGLLVVKKDSQQVMVNADSGQGGGVTHVSVTVGEK